jgi:citrate lyase subunit alpha/citrate CoA-transferase
LTIIVTPLIRGRIPCVVDSVNTVITPGESIPIYTIEQLKEKAYNIVGVPDKIEYEDEVVGIIEYRDGSIIDVVRKVK